jgi:hypothetical protein
LRRRTPGSDSVLDRAEGAASPILSTKTEKNADDPNEQNAMTRYLLQEMQKISTLQSDIAGMPGELSALDHDLAYVLSLPLVFPHTLIDPSATNRTRTDNFKHLARLEGLIPAYVATVAEVVRRREYCPHPPLFSLSLFFSPTESFFLLSHFSQPAFSTPTPQPSLPPSRLSNPSN